MVGSGVNCGFLAAAVGLAFDDEFVRCGGEAVDAAAVISTLIAKFAV